MNQPKKPTPAAFGQVAGGVDRWRQVACQSIESHAPSALGRVLSGLQGRTRRRLQEATQDLFNNRAQRDPRTPILRVAVEMLPTRPPRQCWDRKTMSARLATNHHNHVQLKHLGCSAAVRPTRVLGRLFIAPCGFVRPAVVQDHGA